MYKGLEHSPAARAVAASRRRSRARAAFACFHTWESDDLVYVIIHRILGA